MASFAPLHTGQFIIKQRALARSRAARVGQVVLALSLIYGAFELGRALSGYSVISSQRHALEQTAHIHRLQSRLDELQHELTSTQLGRKVDQQSTDATQRSFTELQSTIQKQQEELAFYKAIVSPTADAAVQPQVQRLEVRTAAGERRYLLRLVLIQSMQATRNAQGTLVAQVTGVRQGQPVMLPLEDLMVGARSGSLAFAYRYFQTLEQLIELPDEFQPQSVQVQVNEGQRVLQRQDFPWQPLPG